MHIDFRAQFRKSPRRAGVIEMNVTEKNVADIVRRETGFAKIDNHIVECRFRPGIEQRDTGTGLEGGRGNNSGVAKLSCI
jgi:hypothetical protein